MQKVFVFLLAICMVSAALVSGSRAESVDLITGDYVEVRTASVFAGACHYNGELTTTGRDALLALRVKSGTWRGVDLAGVKALAVISSNVNLAETGARRSEMIVSDTATHAQTIALVDALKERNSNLLGRVISVSRAPLTFDHEHGSYAVAAPGRATIEVEAMPDDMCCRMPHLVWYQPLMSLEQRKVGYTKIAKYGGKHLTESWERTGENSSFYGTFSF